MSPYDKYKQKPRCARCNRELSEGSTHCGDLGDSCGLCVDRENGYRKWQQLKEQSKTILDFDEWYDRNA